MQTEDINFNELWLGQKVEQPSAEDLLLKLNTYKRKNRNKILILNLVLLLTSLFIASIWYYHQPQFITTKIGIVVVIVGMFLWMLSQNKSLILFKKTDETQSSRNYLQTLLRIKEKQQFMQTTMLNLYFILLSTGIGLYMYEYAARMTLAGGLSAYGLTALWILFNWVYLRPKQIKKQQAKLNELIAKFEDIQAQLDEK